MIQFCNPGIRPRYKIIPGSRARYKSAIPTNRPRIVDSPTCRSRIIDPTLKSKSRTGFFIHVHFDYLRQDQGVE